MGNNRVCRIKKWKMTEVKEEEREGQAEGEDNNQKEVDPQCWAIKNGKR